MSSAPGEQSGTIVYMYRELGIPMRVFQDVEDAINQADYEMDERGYPPLSDEKKDAIRKIQIGDIIGIHDDENDVIIGVEWIPSRKGGRRRRTVRTNRRRHRRSHKQ
jgi:hypothetical protein